MTCVTMNERPRHDVSVARIISPPDSTRALAGIRSVAHLRLQDRPYVRLLLGQ